MQTYDRTGIVGCARKVYAEGGFGLFYKGVQPYVIVATIARPGS